MGIVEFSGIGREKLRKIIYNRNSSAKIVYRKDNAVCGGQSKETTYVDSYDDAFCYYLDCGPCYYVNCGPSCTYGSRSRSDCSCTGTDDSSSNCDMGDDNAAGGIIAIFAVIALVLLIIIFLPYVIGAAVIVFNLALAGILALFNVITLGAFKDRFRKTHVNLPDTPREEFEGFIKEVAYQGGVPTNIPGLDTMGFNIFKIGAYFLIPSLFLLPILYFGDVRTAEAYFLSGSILLFSLLLLWIGNLQILNAKNKIKKTLMG